MIMNKAGKTTLLGKWFFIFASALIVCIGMNAMQAFALAPADTRNNNFTVIAPDGSLYGGSNDVHFTWNGTLKTSVAASGQIGNASISSNCTFSTKNWYAHDVAVYGPGTYTVYSGCAAGSPGCGTGTPMTFTVGAGEIGIHMLVKWGALVANSNIDVVNVLRPSAVFGPSPMQTGGSCGSNSGSTVWDWTSRDDGTGKSGYPMVDGAFAGYRFNFNLMGIPVPGVVDTANNNFTMYNADGLTLTGGTNDVGFTWDGTKKTSVAEAGQIPNATLSSYTKFFGFNWIAHDVAVYGPGGPYTIYTGCTSGNPGCGAGTPMTFSVGAGELGAHMLFDWGSPTAANPCGLQNCDIDVVDVWTPMAVFDSGLSCFADPVTYAIPMNCLWTGATGSSSVTQVWDWMSSDFNGNGVHGMAMVDGAFAGFYANFNVMGVPPDPAPVSFAPPSINAMMRAPVQQAYAATRLRPMEHPAMTAMPAPRMMSAPTAPAAAQRSFAPPSINATMRAPVIRQQVYAATRIRPMEQPAMTGMPAPRVMFAPTAPAAGQRWFAPPSISAMMRARVQPGVCSNPVKTNGTTCNDGNACTTSDVCTNGACGGTAVVCTALDQCHDAGTCSGRCMQQPGIRPMERPAMTGMPAPRVMFAPTAPAAAQQSFAPPSISATMRVPVPRAYAATRLRPMGQRAMTAMPARQVTFAPTAPAAAQRSFAPRSINVTMPAPVQQAYAATRLRPMEQRAMTAMPARRVTFAPTAPAAAQQSFAPPWISAMMRAPVQPAYAATRIRPMEQPAMTAMPAPQVMSAPMESAAAQRSFAPRSINAMMRAPVQPAYAATRLRPMEHPAMITICVPQVMFAPTAPAVERRRFARQVSPVIHRMDYVNNSV